MQKRNDARVTRQCVLEVLNESPQLFEFRLLLGHLQ